VAILCSNIQGCPPIFVCVDDQCSARNTK
jgi:hypothetical protein